MTIIFQLLLFFGGATLASFFQLLAERQPLALDVVFTPSYCNNCHTQLAACDLIPIIGYCLQRGHCRYCDCEISPTSMFWEFIGGISLLWLAAQWSCWQNGAWLICLLLLQLAIFDDAHYYVEQLYLSQLLIVIIILAWPQLTVNLLPAFFCFIGLFLISQLTLGLGSADVQLISMLVLIYDLHSMLWVCLLANLLILLNYLIAPQTKKFAFIPYLYFALLMAPLLPSTS